MKTFAISNNTDVKNKLTAYSSSSILGFKLVLLFVFSIFIQSNDATLKIASINASSITAMLMVIVFLMDGFLKGEFKLLKHPCQRVLFLLFVWALISVLISKVDPSKAIPLEAYNYNWISGLNSPGLRGISFLFRLFLSVFVIEFIILSVNTEKKFFKTINYFIFAYSFVCLFVFIQMLSYILFNKSLGYVLEQENSFRLGGYIGEPSTLGGILVCGYFILFATMTKYYPEIRFPRKLVKILFIIATVDLIFTFSAAWIPATVISLLIIGRRHLNKKILIIICCSILIGVVFSTVFVQSVFLKAFKEASTINVRTDSWIAGIHIFLKNPITGVGLGHSPFFTPLFMPSGYIHADFYDMRFPPINTYIQWLAETGAVGLFILLIFLYLIFRSGKMLRQSEYQNIIKFGFGGGLMASLIAITAVPDYLYTGSVNFLIAMYIAGVMIFKERNVKIKA